MNEKNDNIFKPKSTGPVLAALLLVLVIAVIVVVVFVIASSAGGSEKPNNSNENTTTTTTTTTLITSGDPKPNTSDKPQTTQKPSTSDNPSTPGVTANTVSVDTNKAYEGVLLLIDQTHNYKMNKDLLISRSEMSALTAKQLLDTYNFVNVYGTTGGNYKVKSVSGYYLNADALDALNKMMADFAAQQGKTDVQLRNAYYYDANEAVCLNATGLVIDLEINTENGKYPLKYTPFKEIYYDWFMDNCAKYGYIHIADAKSSSGEENYSSFRYVGVAHASYMNSSEMKLDQYLTFIKGYGYENRLVTTADDGNEWWIYYVPGTGDTTTFKVIGNNYEISGNNYDGFVIAVNASALSA